MVEKIQLVPGSLTGIDKAKTAGKSEGHGLKKGLLKNLDIDKFGLSADARDKVVWARSQFELNYQVLRSINSANGYETTEETFSFKGSYEFMQLSSGNETAPVAESAADAPVEETAEQDMLASLQDYFSPENTAQRILDIATSFFGISEIAKAEGDTEAARQKFSDFIGSAIDEGFRQARDILGDLPENVSTGIEKTHSLVFAGLADFVKNGINPEKLRAGGVFEKIAAYREEARAEMAARLKSSSTVGYNASGEAQIASTTTPTISTKG